MSCTWHIILCQWTSVPCYFKIHSEIIKLWLRHENGTEGQAERPTDRLRDSYMPLFRGIKNWSFDFYKYMYASKTHTHLPSVRISSLILSWAACWSIKMNIILFSENTSVYTWVYNFIQYIDCPILSTVTYHTTSSQTFDKLVCQYNWSYEVFLNRIKSYKHA